MTREEQIEQYFAFTERRGGSRALIFRTSLLGRVIHGITTALAVYLPWVVIQPFFQGMDEAIAMTLVLTIGLPSAWLAVYSACYAFGSSRRLLLDDAQLVYYGIFSSIAIPWEAIRSFKVQRSRLVPFEFLVISAPGVRWRRFGLNVTSTQPGTVILSMAVRHMLRQGELRTDSDEREFEQDLATLKHGKLDGATMAGINARMEKRMRRMEELMSRAVSGRPPR